MKRPTLGHQGQPRELKNILPPREIQNAMEKQMKAERERRESILQAEGQKQSQILVAEGEKQSTILRADAEKQAAILKAEAERQAAILKAEGEAQAILTCRRHSPTPSRCSTRPTPTIRSSRSRHSNRSKAADGQATKIIVPSEIQSSPVSPRASRAA